MQKRAEDNRFGSRFVRKAAAEVEAAGSSTNREAASHELLTVIGVAWIRTVFQALEIRQLYAPAVAINMYTLRLVALR
ncbi:hypothetical protein GJ744_000916 [Endocarpon pusillum]|uniref:Uncharacterized protein n=1 Tax=Endocarpon pusillum TaxID=364733 RepID=A0A8H7ANT9_9EURO|nr:hypothetical protein GJ744_000916 [Endocarpon pusillum]